MFGLDAAMRCITVNDDNYETLLSRHNSTQLPNKSLE